MKKYDLIVIGSGSGLDVAAEAAERGLSVAIVEQGPFGGTCLNRGCIPSKMLIHCADVMETIETAELFGIRAKVEAVDWQFIIKRVFSEIDADARSIEEGNRQADNVSVYKGTGHFVGEKILEVNGEQISAETVLIAAGTRPTVPDIPGLRDIPYLTSDEALRLPKQPDSLAIIGGGYIAAELAHFFGSLGTKVTIIHRRTTLLREEDEEVARRFTEMYQGKFNLLLDAQTSRGYRNSERVALDVSIDGRTQTVVADALLLATGRVPNSDLLEVERTGLEVDTRGFIKANEFLETGVPGIWALGDIVGKNLLKHNANLEAEHVAYNMFHRDKQVAVDYHAMPHAIFASPQVGSVGMTEQEAKKREIKYVASTYDYFNTAYGRSIEDRDGFVKVLAQPETGEILGCHIIGSHASILIQEVANAMRLRLTTEAIKSPIYVHPALPEVVQRAFLALNV